ncbi:hypothetical protein PMIN04_008976 [Paraphaeosphaeria minitans]
MSAIPCITTMRTPLENLLASLHQDASVTTADINHNLAHSEPSRIDLAADIIAISHFLDHGNETSALLRALHALLAISNSDLEAKLAFWNDVRVRARLQSPMRWERGVSVRGVDADFEAGGRNWWLGSADASVRSRLFAVVGFLVAPEGSRKWRAGGYDGEEYVFPGKAHYESWKNELIGRCRVKKGGSRLE